MEDLAAMVLSQLEQDRPAQPSFEVAPTYSALGRHELLTCNTLCQRIPPHVTAHVTVSLTCDPSFTQMHICVKGWEDLGYRQGFGWHNQYAVVRPRLAPKGMLLCFDLYFQTEHGRTSPSITFETGALERLPALLLAWTESRPVERVATRVIHVVHSGMSPLTAVPLQTFYLNGACGGQEQVLNTIQAVLRALPGMFIPKADATTTNSFQKQVEGNILAEQNAYRGSV